MKVIFEKSELLSALVPASGMVPGHNTAAAIDGILFECPGDDTGMCRISSYDLEKGVRTSIPARIMEEGKFILNTQKVLQIIRALPEGDVEISVNSNMNATISSGASSFEIQAVDGADFPGLPLLSGERNFKLSGKALRRLISKTVISVSVGDTRPVFTGVYFKIENGTITAVGCDTNRMTVCEEDTDNAEQEAKVIIPAKILNEVLKAIKDTDDEVNISVARKHVIFDAYGVLYFTRIIDADYIDYSRIIPRSHTTEVFVNCEQLRRAIERASVITEDKLGGSMRSPLKIEIKGNNMNISATSASGSLTEDVPIAKNGDDLTIGFSGRYLLDALRTCGEAYTLRIRLNSSVSGIKIEEACGSTIAAEDGDENAVVPSGYERPECDGTEKMKFMYFIMPRKITNG